MVRSPVRGYLSAGLMALGWAVQTAFLANLWFKDPMAPVASAFGSLMLLSWIVALIGLYLMLRSPKPVAVGIFVLPLVLGLVVATAGSRRENPTGSTGAVPWRSGAGCTGSSCWPAPSSPAWRSWPG